MANQPSDTPAEEASTPRDASESADALAARVTVKGAARMLRRSPTTVRALIDSGDLPVIQPGRGRQPTLIEVAALHALMDQWRVQAQRRATRRAKSAAAKRGAA